MKMFIRGYYCLWLLALSVLLCLSCSQNKGDMCYLIVGESIDNVELDAITDLKNDLEKVVGDSIAIIPETASLPDNGSFFVLGTTGSNALIKKLADRGTIDLSEATPGPRGGVWTKTQLSSGQEAIVIGGSDVQGLQYAIYDYSKEILGVDPLEYWTGKLPGKKLKQDLYDFTPRAIPPPKVPLLAYFENDVDELANYRGNLLEYDWETYTELIDALVRLRYNAIQLFDMLGRPEFFIRPEYKELKPDYQIDVAYVEKMIDYAHEKGMKIAIDFNLGYQIHPMSIEKADCWKTYKNDWLDAWRYYFEETPLAKTDIFILRPRHQVWDWKYESSCGEDKIAVFNEVYKAFGNLVDEYKSDATKVLGCYSDGMEMWNNGFRPPKDWIVLWSDHGFGDFEHLPNTTDGYVFGTYMHAGYWLNHTVHNPYPNKIETVMKDMFQNYKADAFCLVNGQTFRPFLLNIEAYSAVCNDPETFNGDDFYKRWTERYFSNEVAQHAVASMKWLHKAQEGRKGYVEHLWEIREAVSYLSNTPIKRPGKTPVPYDYKRVEGDFENTRRCVKYLDKALAEAKSGYEKAEKANNFYHDHILLPTVLYSDLLAFETTLHKMAVLKQQFETTKNVRFLEESKGMVPLARDQLATIFKHRESGDLDTKWNNWYGIEIRRRNNGFPSVEMLDDIASNLNKMTL